MVDDQVIPEEEQLKILRRYTRMQKIGRRLQAEQEHKLKTKYNRKKFKHDWKKSINEGDEDYE